jgi:hypothetical protein
MEFGPRRDEVAEDMNSLHSEERHIELSLPHIISHQSDTGGMRIMNPGPINAQK